MNWLLLEVLIALFLLIGIVWWTMPTKREEEKRHGTAHKDD
jgi:hypothetical protein